MHVRSRADDVVGARFVHPIPHVGRSFVRVENKLLPVFDVLVEHHPEDVHVVRWLVTLVLEDESKVASFFLVRNFPVDVYHCGVKSEVHLVDSPEPDVVLGWGQPLLNFSTNTTDWVHGL